MYQWDEMPLVVMSSVSLTLCEQMLHSYLTWMCEIPALSGRLDKIIPDECQPGFCNSFFPSLIDLQLGALRIGIYKGLSDS